jgi:hypothetical protein
VSVTSALAQEPVGCDKFKWSLEKERATLTGTDLPKVASGERINWPLPFATTLTLVPLAEAKLPVTPERAPRSSDSFAGFVQLPALTKVGTYQITLSAAGWIDVVQDGQRAKSTASTGATGCAGVRKSVKFELIAAPLIVEVSGIEAKSVGIAIGAE